MAPEAMIWWVLGWAVSLAGAALALWALFRDRSRGRRRCPRCWYDLSATAGMKCPECGCEAKREKQLFRTRRRWGWAVVGAVLIALGPMVGFGINAAIHGAWSAMPNAGLIAGYPWLDQFGEDELHSRLGNGELRVWESRWLSKRCQWGIHHSNETARVQRDLVFCFWLVRMANDGPRTTPWGAWLTRDKLVDDRTIQRLFELLHDPDRTIAAWSATTLRQLGPQLQPHLPRWFDLVSKASAADVAVLDSLIVLLHGPNAKGFMPLFDDTWLWVAQRPRINIDAPGVRELLQKIAQTQLRSPEFELVIDAGLADPDPLVRRVAVRSLAHVRRGEVSARDRLLRLANEPDHDVRLDLLGVISAFPADDGTVDVIARVFADDPLSDAAAVAAGDLGNAGRRFQPQLLRGLMGDRIGALWAFGRAYRAIGGEKPPLCKVVERLTLDASERLPSEDEARLIAIAEAGAECSHLLGFIETLLGEQSSSRARMLAAELYFNSGGEVARALKALHEALTDPALRYRRDYISAALRRSLSTGALDPTALRPWLSDASPAVRRAAAEALSANPKGAAALLDDLVPLFDDPDPDVVNAAAYAHRLIEWYRDHPDATPTNRERP